MAGNRVGSGFYFPTNTRDVQLDYGEVRDTETITNTIKDIVKEFSNYDLVLVPYEKENSVTMQNAIIDNLKAKNIACIVGSEGGFSEEEIEFLCEHGAKAITLGNRILRAETASIAISSVLMYAFGEWDKWKLF